MLSIITYMIIDISLLIYQGLFVALPQKCRVNIVKI